MQPHTEAQIATLEAQLMFNLQPEEIDVVKTEGELLQNQHMRKTE